MAKKFDLELRVTTFGSVLSWEVLLENTNESSRVENWVFNSQGKYFFRELPGFSINDEALDVFVGCEGKQGGSTTCTIVINGNVQNDKVTCKNTDPNYAHGTYPVN